MTTWNYRIVKRRDECFALHEVYYDIHEKPEAMTENAISFTCDIGEGPEGIIESLKMALRDAESRPVLDEAETWPND